MSHFTSIKKQFKNKESLIKALKHFGFEPIEHEEAQQLYGYKGDKRKQQAHIIVPRKQIGGPSNDLGFYWTGEEYECIISDYDRHSGAAKAGRGLGSSFLPQLSAQYAINEISAQTGMEYLVSDYRVLADGTVSFNLEVQEQFVSMSM